VKGSRFKVQGSRFRVQGSRFTVHHLKVASGSTVQRFNGSAVHTPAGYKRFKVQGEICAITNYFVIARSVGDVAISLNINDY